MWGTKSGQFVLQFTMCVKLMKTKAHLEIVYLKFQKKDYSNNHHSIQNQIPSKMFFYLFLDLFLSPAISV